MSRSAKKGFYINPKLQARAIAQKAATKPQPIKVYDRAATITPEFVGLTFQVHNGKDFIDVFVQEDMVGDKLGMYSPTTKFRGHGGKGAK